MQLLSCQVVNVYSTLLLRPNDQALRRIAGMNPDGRVVRSVTKGSDRLGFDACRNDWRVGVNRARWIQRFPGAQLQIGYDAVPVDELVVGVTVVI